MKKVIPFLILLVLFFLALSPALFRPKPGAGESWLPRFTRKPPQGAPYRNSALSPERRTEDLLSRMTLEEKAAQLLCPEGEPLEAFFSRDGRLLSGNLSVRYPGGVGFAAGIGRIHGGLGPEQTASRAGELLRWSRTGTRLGIPILVLEGGNAGSASPGSTRFPSPLGQAASWDREPVRALWALAALENRCRGITLMTLPGPEAFGSGPLGALLAEAAREGVAEVPGILPLPGGAPFTVSEPEGIRELYRSTGLRTQGVLCATDRGISADRGATLAYRDLPELVRSGRFEEEALDALVRPILLTKFRMGLFDTENQDAGDPARIVGSPGHARKAREAAEGAFVLLENRRETLPLDPDRIWTLAVIGPGAEQVFETAPDRPVYQVSPLRGLKDYGRGRFDVIHGVGCRPEAATEDWELLEQAESAASRAEAVILVLIANGPDGTLGGRQKQLLENVTDRGTPVILVILADTPPRLPQQVERARAVIVGFAPGQETGRALARLVFGEADFRGRLPVSLSGNYPLGYGLTTTGFRWGKVRHERGLLTLEITNTGTRRGTETVQLYISRRSVGTDWPGRELVDFRKATLEPGETRTVTFFTGRYAALIPADGDLTLIPARNSAENLYRIPLNSPAAP